MPGGYFQKNLKVLPLDCYDAIIGMDWLQAHSPMQVDWIRKWMIIPAGKQQYKLQVITANTSECEEISHGKLLSLEEQQALLYCFLLNPVQ